MTDGWKKPKPVEKEEQETVDGSFVCQRCAEYVSVAIYLPLRGVLTWKCSQGHKSFIKDVNW